MAGPHPILPTYRLTFPYVVDGFPHVMHFYLATTPTGDPSGFNTIARAGHSGTGVAGIFARWWTTIEGSFDAVKAQFGNGHLDHFVFPNWIPVYTETNSVVPTSGFTYNKAGLATWSGYGNDHEKMKFILTEPSLGSMTRYIHFPTGVATIDLMASALFNVGGGATDQDPYAWALDRDNYYIGSVVSLVLAPSKHWRRKRGLG